MSKQEREAEEHMEKAGLGRKCEGWFEKIGYTLSIKMECWRK